MKEAFYPLHKQDIARAWQQESTFLQADTFVRYLVVKPAYANAA